MRLSEYIEAVGDEPAAKLFGVKKITAYSWRKGYRLPRPKKAKEIEKITKGKVTVRDCY